MLRASSSVRAFTLIEVLVALAIFAFAGLVLAGAYINVLNGQQAALRRDELADDLQLVRTVLRAQSDVTVLQNWNNLELPEGRKVRWRATYAATNLADLFDVTMEVEITAENGTKYPTVTETFRLLRPTWSQPADREKLISDSRSRLQQMRNNPQ